MNIDAKKQFTKVLDAALTAAMQLGAHNIDRTAFGLFIAQAESEAQRLQPLDQEALKSLAALKQFASRLPKSSPAKTSHSSSKACFF